MRLILFILELPSGSFPNIQNETAKEREELPSWSNDIIKMNKDICMTYIVPLDFVT